MALILPRFVAIDSSILAVWSLDAFSENSERQARARNAVAVLLTSNWIPIICLHHFIELARHSDLDIVAKRIDFLKSFSEMAWFGRSESPNLLGGIADIYEAELGAILASPDIDIPGIRRTVKEKLVQFGRPTKIDFINEWKFFHPAFQAMAIREQEIASIVHAHPGRHDDELIMKLQTVKRKEQGNFHRPTRTEIEQLAKDLIDRGDTRLTDPLKTAQGFLDMASTHFAENLNREGNSLDVFLARFDVPQSDISDKTTVKEFAKIARRRKISKDAVIQLGIDLNQAWPKIRDAKIPSEIIQETIRKARGKVHRASGSDIGDDYLACLAPYVDAVIVDKRTHEFLTQGARRDPSFRQMVGFFGKAASYETLSAVLATYPGAGTA